MEGDRHLKATTGDLIHFNPRPPHGGRRIDPTNSGSHKNFNPRPPHGGRRGITIKITKVPRFQSTPSAWRATSTWSSGTPWSVISIHALRMEGDTESYTLLQVYLIFQSTPSAWRATNKVKPCTNLAKYFNPRPPHGGRPEVIICGFHHDNFNPRPPHGGRPAPASGPWCRLDFNPRPPHGGRQLLTATGVVIKTFQSTPSAWRATAPP